LTINDKWGLFWYWKRWKTENIGFGWTPPLSTLIYQLIPGVSEIQHISDMSFSGLNRLPRRSFSEGESSWSHELRAEATCPAKF
jgi:hypothetical protein